MGIIRIDVRTWAIARDGARHHAALRGAVRRGAVRRGAVRRGAVRRGGGPGGHRLIDQPGTALDGDDIRYARGTGISDGTDEEIAEAVAAASASEIAILVLGERSGLTDDSTTGEFRDRSTLGFHGRQQELLEALVRGLTAADLLINLPTLLNLVGDTVASDIPLEHMPYLAQMLQKADLSSAERLVIQYPLAYADNLTDGTYILVPDIPAIQAAVADLRKQASAGTPLRLARESARQAVERSFAMPLQAAGFENAKVVASFATDGTRGGSRITGSTPYSQAIEEGRQRRAQEGRQ